MRAAIAFGVCLLLFSVAGDSHGLRARQQARRDMRALADRIAVLRAENARLREQADALRRDPAAVEAVARRTLGLLRRGEIVVIRSR